MDMIRALKLGKVHLFGHHAGSGLAMEMAAVYPEEILTAALSAPALATPEMQASMFVTIAAEWSKPKEDGSHLMRVWDVLSPLIPDLDVKNHEVLDALRAWKGRDQAYKVLFKQNKIGFYKQITCPLLAMCSREDVLWPCFRFCSELVSHQEHIF
jgi:pimeloyl-ACP methyl ester carboxylesterase